MNKFEYELVIPILTCYGLTEKELKDAGLEIEDGQIKPSLNAMVLSDFLTYAVLDIMNESTSPLQQ